MSPILLVMIGFILWVTTSVFWVTILTAVIVGIRDSLYNYWLAFKNNLKLEIPTITNTSSEPAINSYFFGKGYHDLGTVIKESWNRNLKSPKYFFSSELLDYIFWIGAKVSAVVFGALFLFALSLLHFLFLVLFFLLKYIGFTIVGSIERIYFFVHGFFSACSHCYEKTALPEYVCDNCGKIHTKLKPNSYGIFFHQCQCGQKLPATFFLNRGRLQARCQACHQLLHRDHIESRKIFIPILGGSSAGKTAFMFAVVRKLVEEKAAGFETAFIDSNTESEYRNVINQLCNGKVPTKTVTSIPKAFNLALKKGRKTKWVLYIYDPAGEAFEDTKNLFAHRYDKYLSGMVMIIDPFSIPAVKRKYENNLSTCSSVNPSQLNVEDVLDRVLLTMEESSYLSKTGKFNKPLAVVISKVDAFGLEKIIGEEAVDKRNDRIRQQLINWDEGALIQKLDTRFKKVRYFSCSALGRIPDSRSNDEFVPQHVFEPISWLLNTVFLKFARQAAVLITIIFCGIGFFYDILSYPDDDNLPSVDSSTLEIQQSIPHIPTQEVIYQENDTFHLGDQKITSDGWKVLHGNCFTATFSVIRPIQTLTLKLDIWHSDSHYNAIFLNENKLDTFLPYQKPHTKKWIKAQIVLPTNKLQQNRDNQLQICSGVTTEGDKDDLQIRKIKLIAE